MFDSSYFVKALVDFKGLIQQLSKKDKLLKPFSKPNVICIVRSVWV